MRKQFLKLVAAVLAVRSCFTSAVTASAAESADSNDNAIVRTMSTGVTPMVCAGDDFSAALRSDGTVWCWGYNIAGQLGDGTVIIRKTPVQVKNLNLFVEETETTTEAPTETTTQKKRNTHRNNNTGSCLKCRHIFIRTENGDDK